MLEVFHHQDGNAENITPAASIKSILAVSEFDSLGEVAQDLERAGFIEVSLCCDLVRNGRHSNILFGVQALSRIQYKQYDYSVIGIQGSLKLAKLIDEIDREDMAPWQAVMDGLPLEQTAIPDRNWQALERFHGHAWEKVVDALIAVADSSPTLGQPQIGRSPLWNYMFTQ